MSVNNVQAVSDMLKYVNGMNIEEEKTSITKSVTESIFNPFNVVFAGGDVVSGLKSSITPAGQDPKKLKDLFALIKNKQLGSTLVSNGITTDKNIVNQLKNSVNKAVSNAVRKSTASGAKNKVFAKIGGFFSGIKTKIGSLVSHIPVVNKIVNSKAAKVFKGGGGVGIAVMEGIGGLFFDVVPAFKECGFSGGLKQLGKTTAKAVASGAGWAAGGVAGEAIGHVVGSFLGPVGTLVGGIIGKCVGQLAGSAIASGIAGKITGKSEVEKKQEEQIYEQAQMIANDPASMSQLNALVVEQAQSELVSGTNNANTDKILEYINSGDIVITPQQLDQTSTVVDPQTLTAQTTTIPTTVLSNQDYLNSLVDRINQGDTSIYAIDNDRLNSVFTESPATDSFGFGQTTYAVDTGSIFQGQNQVTNYFS